MWYANEWEDMVAMTSNEWCVTVSIQKTCTNQTIARWRTQKKRKSLTKDERDGQKKWKLEHSSISIDINESNKIMYEEITDYYSSCLTWIENNETTIVNSFK